MKKIIAIVLTLCCLCAIVGCGVQTTGISQEDYDTLKADYDAVVTERDLLLEALGEEPVEETSNSTTPTNLETSKPTGAFDANAVIEQLEVTQYSYSDRYWNYAFLVIKNNSEYNLDVSADVKFYNEAGELIGAKNSSQEAFEAQTETIMYFLPDEAFSKMEYEITVSEEEWYECVVSYLSYEMTPAKDKEIVSVTNNGTEAAEFVEGSMLFFNGDSVVGFNSTYFTDDDSELKPGKTITEEMNCYESYDSVKLYLTGRR